MRKPRILTWSSARPRYSSRPSAVQRARSPVRYMPRARAGRTGRRRTARRSAPGGPGSRGPGRRRRGTARPATPGGTGLQRGVEDVRPGAGDRACRSERPGAVADAGPRRCVDGGLGRAVHVERTRCRAAPRSRCHSAAGTASPPTPTTASGQRRRSRPRLGQLREERRGDRRGSRRRAGDGRGEQLAGRARTSSDTTWTQCPSEQPQLRLPGRVEARTTRRDRPADAAAGRATAGPYSVSRWLGTRLATPAWVTTTPLGRPVEPEV